jgi:hypothetical protein
MKYDVDSNLTLLEIALRLGVTPQYVHIVEKRALAKMRVAANALGIGSIPWGGAPTRVIGFGGPR